MASEIQALSRMRRAIAKSMSASAAIPQFTIEMTLDVTRLRAARERVPRDRRPSYADALVASVAHALGDHPGVNASFTDDGILLHEERNIAFAVAVEGGVISPVIARADTLALADLAAERVRLTAAARAGTLTAKDVLSATFTLSNLGPLGVRRFRALVVPPQAAILAVGAVEDDAMALTLSADHRVLDGAPAAQFLRRVRSLLESEAWVEPLFAGLAGER